MPPRFSTVAILPCLTSSVAPFIRSPTPRFLRRMATLPPDNRPIVVSGPSGVGKGTLYNLLFQRHPDTFTLSVSHTTRAPRDGEQHGVHYHFVPMEHFEDLISRDGFVEHAKFSGNRYGTSKMTIEEQTRKGKVVVLDIEMEGVKQIKQSDVPARFVFIAPPDCDILEARLRGRGTETEESIQKRLAQAKNELEYSKTPGVHDIIIVNDNLEKAYKQLEDFVYKPLDA
ncbi:Guanylate kinase [Purpureocillium takamizusanense]|uniref:Guanylate kinase n=1 Tax=Purpureocillium takamizusanense TaxID=2060973 RepID=A0A9Q8QFK5_9HYPO|nr:Guanylate kinase [Purpureocillium takamizusanense]UNI19914.1 Guanylate kinase [Purpureocillium takamizusanense]